MYSGFPTKHLLLLNWLTNEASMPFRNRHSNKIGLFSWKLSQNLECKGKIAGHLYKTKST